MLSWINCTIIALPSAQGFQQGSTWKTHLIQNRWSIKKHKYCTMAPKKIMHDCIHPNCPSFVCRFSSANTSAVPLTLPICIYKPNSGNNIGKRHLIISAWFRPSKDYWKGTQAFIWQHSGLIICTKVIISVGGKNKPKQQTKNNPKTNKVLKSRRWRKHVLHICNA